MFTTIVCTHTIGKSARGGMATYGRYSNEESSRAYPDLLPGKTVMLTHYGE